jgi:hypothetical protein
LSASRSEASTHVLAVLAQAALEKYKPNPQSNVRTIVSPAQIKQLATANGLRLEKEEMLTPQETVHDCRWETAVVRSEEFLHEVREFVKDERDRSVVLALRDATLASLTKLQDGVKGVRSMDVWVSEWTTMS